MKKIIALSIVACGTTFAQSSLEPLPGDETLAPFVKKEKRKGLPGDQGFSELLDDQIKVARQAFQDSVQTEPKEKKEKKAEQKTEEKVVAVPKKIVEKARPKPLAPKKAAMVHKKVLKKAQPPTSAPSDVFIDSTGVTVFRRHLDELEEEVLNIPGLSSAYATILDGEEITSTGGDWVAARLDYAFLGANGAVVELKGCRVRIDAKANFHTGKVKGQLKEIFCMSPNGHTWQENLEGKMVSATTGYGGIDSDVIMGGPARGMALDAISKVVSGVGQAMAAVETTTKAIGNEYDVREIRNITGDKKRYIGGKTLEATGDFLDYVVSFYKSLEPSLALPPGTKIHVMLKNTVSIPYEFFKQSFDMHDIKKELSQ